MKYWLLLLLSLSINCFATTAPVIIEINTRKLEYRLVALSAPLELSKEHVEPWKTAVPHGVTIQLAFGKVLANPYTPEIMVSTIFMPTNEILCVKQTGPVTPWYSIRALFPALTPEQLGRVTAFKISWYVDADGLDTVTSDWVPFKAQK